MIAEFSFQADQSEEKIHELGVHIWKRIKP